MLKDLTREQQIERMRSDFVANASHELRTPLASLSGFIDTLQGAARADEVAREKFLNLMRTGDHTRGGPLAPGQLLPKGADGRSFRCVKAKAGHR